MITTFVLKIIIKKQKIHQIILVIMNTNLTFTSRNNKLIPRLSK